MDAVKRPKYLPDSINQGVQMNLIQQGLVRARSQQQSVSGEHKTHSANFLNKYKGEMWSCKEA